jgi:CheY-like chemotaxis protein
MMPGMDGGALARRVAMDRPGLPVLLITGYTGPTDAIIHLPRLAKPFGQSEIAAALAGLFVDGGSESDANVVQLRSRAP